MPIGISQYNKTVDAINVYINGIRLTNVLDYTVKDNTSIVLTKPLDVFGTIVTFVILKSLEKASI